MLDFLFRRLTAQPSRGRELFEALIAQAREPHWYVEGTVPDTLDGRFAVLATVNALLLVRLEDEGEAGNQLSVALTERFIEVMESEHRELGMGDPTLGRTVRKLVGSLSRRTDLWRAAVKGDADWAATARGSLYKEGVAPDALRHSAGALERIWSTLQAADFAQIAAGDMR
jgi:cytochrome b pre-mRNA-processing protein 3